MRMAIDKSDQVRETTIATTIHCPDPYAKYQEGQDALTP